MKSSNPKNNNPHGNPETLTPFKKKWKSGKTRTIRVPITLADKGLELIRLMDDGKSFDHLCQEPSSESKPDKTEAIDKQKIARLAQEAFAAKSNAGGHIKELFAEVLAELDIPVTKQGRSWIVDDSLATDTDCII